MTELDRIREWAAEFKELSEVSAWRRPVLVDAIKWVAARLSKEDLEAAKKICEGVVNLEVK